MADDFGVAFLGSIPLDPRFVSLSDGGKVFIAAEKDHPIAAIISGIVEAL